MRRIFPITLTLIFIFGILFLYVVMPRLSIATGYAAKKACSCRFIDQRPIEIITSQDLGTSPLNLVKLKFDKKGKQVEARIFGFAKSTAKFKGDLGCVLIQGEDQNDLSPYYNLKTNIAVQDSTRDTFAIYPQYYTSAQKSAIIQSAFDTGHVFEKKTRALVVLKNDSIVLEHYAPGFDASSKLLGWSMTKSITNALYGIMAKEGRIDINQNNLFPDWQKDKRSAITLSQLLRMSSGLSWSEEYASVSPATNMLFKKEDMGAFASARKLEARVGQHFEYSSGTTNILSRYMANQFKSHDAYLAYPYQKLFKPLGIDSMVLEVDESGHFVLSSYCFGTPRDWAKIGLLYLQNGRWGDKQIFEPTWLDFSLRPASHAPQGKYGAQLWLNTLNNELKNAPADTYKFSGYEGQYVYIIPSKQMVVVRMGLSKGPPFDMNEVMSKILVN